ncbi:thioredoxin [Candidatus Woesearchaeota archaeon]|nr:thioredoxin [Candidatus Woesearchaeota archaeon]
MVLELTDATFEKEINGNIPIIVDFWASWCGPCKMLAPIFEQVSKEFEGKLKFAKISTEEYQDIASEQSITGIPCLIIFNRGEEVDRIVGFRPKEKLKNDIQEILNQI